MYTQCLQAASLQAAHTPDTCCCCRVLPALEFLPLLPTQQHLDSLQAFLEPVPSTPLQVLASKARLTAKLEHQVQWVQQHLQPDSELCQLARQLVTDAAVQP